MVAVVYNVAVTCIWVTFDLLAFNVILESFVALVSKWSVVENGSL